MTLTNNQLALIDTLMYCKDITNVNLNITLKEIDSYAEMILNYSIDNNEYYTLHKKKKKGELHDEFIVDQK